MGGWWADYWQWHRQRQRQTQWLTLLGLLVLVFLLRSDLIPLHSQNPYLPFKTIQTHLISYVRGEGESQKPLAPSPPQESSNKTRIAVCLVGAARKFELTGPSLLKNVVNKYSNSDVFLYAPFDKDSHKFSLLKDASSLAAVRIFTPQRINETEEQLELLTSNGSPNGIQGLLQYFSLVEGCLTMIKSYQAKHNVKYDWIVRTRVDGYWKGPLPSPKRFPNKSYIVPPGSQYGGLNDRLGIGNMETSEVALSRLSLIPILHSSGYRGLNSETSFKNQLNVKGVKYEFRTFPFCVLSERKYEWPPSRWGVPVASISSKGNLNGAKCRPCTPVLKGIDAMTVVGNLSRFWSWTVPTPGLELCDPRDSWEENWKRIFDKVAGPKFSAVRKNINKRSFTDCIKDFEAMKQKTVEWDALPSKTICKKAFQKRY